MLGCLQHVPDAQLALNGRLAFAADALRPVGDRVAVGATDGAGHAVSMGLQSVKLGCGVTPARPVYPSRGTLSTGQGRKMVNRRDWLLLALGTELDPIRIQKALFKHAR